MTCAPSKDSDQPGHLLMFHKYFQESEGKIQTLQSDISKAEQQQKLDNKQQVDEADRVRKEKEKHEKLRKELEAQRLR